MRWTKYGNKRTFVGTELFDSQHEADRWIELTLMEKAGEISDLRRQVPFILIPEIRNKSTGKVVSRATKYIADFVYTDRNGKTVVEDAKGMQTEVYRLKKKLMLWRYGIVIREV